MTPKIKIELFDNDLYTVKGCHQQNSILSFFDILNTPVNQNSLVNSTFTLTTYNKQINLIPLHISVDIDMDMTDIINVHYIYNEIKLELNKEFIKKVKELSEKNRYNTEYDIIISQIKKKYSDKFQAERFIISRFNRNNNYIISKNRIGPCNWIISNTKTYNYILENISDLREYDKSNHLIIGNMSYIINDFVEDDIIIMGRKNNLENPGVNCIIQIDKDGYIVFDEVINSSSRILRMYGAIVDTGFNPEFNYLNVRIRDIRYYRKKKLEKIKEIYG